jgi:hypothetical protein
LRLFDFIVTFKPSLLINRCIRFLFTLHPSRFSTAVIRR